MIRAASFLVAWPSGELEPIFPGNRVYRISPIHAHFNYHSCFMVRRYRLPVRPLPLPVPTKSQCQSAYSKYYCKNPEPPTATRPPPAGSFSFGVLYRFYFQRKLVFRRVLEFLILSLHTPVTQSQTPYMTQSHTRPRPDVRAGVRQSPALLASVRSLSLASPGRLAPRSDPPLAAGP